jgi:hypothetical protein
MIFSKLFTYLEETRLAMISVLGTDFFGEKHKNKVLHLLNRIFGDISEKAFSLGQSQQKTFAAIRLPHCRCDCRKPPSYVPYKGTYVPYDGTFGTPDQGQMLDV